MKCSTLFCPIAHPVYGIPLKERLSWHRYKSKYEPIVTYFRYKFHQLFDHKCVHSYVHAYRSANLKTE